MSDFDVIVVGSGISGGWAAKELTEKGLKVALVERGRIIEHQTGYTNEFKTPWEMPYRGYGDQKLLDAQYPIQQGRHFNEFTLDHFVNDRDNPYETTGPVAFQWRRGYQLGGRSLTWGRHCYRRGDLDFEANLKDGHGVDWPIRYKDLAPWYDHVEDFIGVSGSKEGIFGLPDGNFIPPFPMNPVEVEFKARVESRYRDRKVIMGRVAHLTEPRPGRGLCQSRDICPRGCSFGAYFSTQSSTLPAARATGNLTLITDAIVETVDYDPAKRRVTGVSILDAGDGTRRKLTARVVFLNASTINTVAILLRSASESFPDGLANSSGTVGRYLMDHAGALLVAARIKGFDGHTTFGNRPNSLIIPRFANIGAPIEGAVRGYSYQGGSLRRAWSRGGKEPGFGKDFKNGLKGPGEWVLVLGAFAECLPRAENRITLADSKVDKYGLKQVRIDFNFSANERTLIRHAHQEALRMVGLMDAEIMMSTDQLGAPGGSVHEMGGARMGRDPRTSVLNGFNQSHDVANLFITDGAAMGSTGTVNPSLTYMALTARAANHAVELMRTHVI
jgi:choline dehydrogenase-like flavoprotein